VSSPTKQKHQARRAKRFGCGGMFDDSFIANFPECLPGMLRPRGLCGLEAKLFGLRLVASGLGLIEVATENHWYIVHFS